MKPLRKVIIIATILITINYMLVEDIYINFNVNAENLIKIGVVLSSFDDLYASRVKKSLEDIQMKDSGKVQFSFYDSKNNEAVQNATISNLVKGGNVDVLFVDLVKRDGESVRNVLGMVKLHNTPVVFTFVSPEAVEVIKSYNKAFVVGTDIKQAGDLQGKIIIDIWNTNRASIDKNNDGILQYVLLTGSNEPAGKQRVLYTISAINNAGIKTQPLAEVNASWDKQLARNAIRALFLRYNNKIEAIISNSDAMAIGAIEAVQQYGYNTGNPSKNVVVVGVDGMPEAIDLIDKGEMAGTIMQDPRDTAEALYAIGMNLYNNKSPLSGTNYKTDKSGVVALLPYKEYKKITDG